MRLNCRVALIWTVLAAAPALAQTGKEADAEASRRPKPSPSHKISEGPSKDSRNPFGFSLGVLGLYDSNVFGTQFLKDGEAAAMFMPRVFSNIGGRKSLLHLDYQFGYRLYPDQRQLNTQNHDGGIEYIYQASRRTSIYLSDHARYGPNDIFSLTSSAFIPTPGPGQTPPQQVFFDRQRVFSNSALGRMAYQSSRRNRFEAWGQNYAYRYYSNRNQDTRSVSVNASDEYQFSRQWSVLAEGSNDWVNSTGGVRDGRVFRALGGLKFRPTKQWEVAGKAGCEQVYSGSVSDTGTTYEASVTHTSTSNRLDFRYWRRSTYQIGLTGLNQSDVVDATFDHQLNSRLSLHLLSRYYRTAQLAYLGKIETVGGSVGFDYAIQPNIVATLFGHYLYQRQAISTVSVPVLAVDRYLVYGGIYYLFPSVKGERRSAVPRGNP